MGPLDTLTIGRVNNCLTDSEGKNHRKKIHYTTCRGERTRVYQQIDQKTYEIACSSVPYAAPGLPRIHTDMLGPSIHWLPHSGVPVQRHVVYLR